MNIKKSTYWKKILLLDNFFIKKVYQNRIKINNFLKKIIFIDKSTTLLDVGTAPSLEKFENVFVRNAEYKENITVLSNVDCSILKSEFPKIKTLISDGSNMLLQNNSYDIVHSNATIEHVGSEEKQLKFISECFRVSKKKVIIITPNRNFFIDFHTKIPFLHLLPKHLHRKILKFLGDDFFSLESNLNLLNSKNIRKFCKTLNIKDYKITYSYFMFAKSNIILLIDKKQNFS